MSDQVSGLVSEAREHFTATFGYPPDGIWSAPGRVNLIGEHTDYNEGFVLPFAIDRRTVAALALRRDRTVCLSSSLTAGVIETSLDAARPPAAHNWSGYPLGVAWGLGEVRPGVGRPAETSGLSGPSGLAGLPGFDAQFVSDVPLGAGLSSSAALESSLAVALNESWGLGLDGARLVTATHLAENDFVGAPTGILDQSASLLSQEGAALFIDCRDQSTAPVDLRLDEFGLTILVMDTRVSHAHASGGYAERRAACERAARALGVRALRDVTPERLLADRGLLDDEAFRRARHVVTEDQRVLDTLEVLRTGGPLAIGSLLTASHYSMRDDFEISTPELDLAVETALEHGAVGARMTGGGFGGSAIALLPVSLLATVREAVAAAFAAAAYRAPDMFAVRPSAGARRDQ